MFFETVQNKMHWATHGETAAEKIYHSADASIKGYMYQLIHTIKDIPICREILSRVTYIIDKLSVRR